MDSTALAARVAPGRGNLIQVGLVLLWASALFTLPLAAGDCVGTAEACAASEGVGRGHMQVLLVALLAVTAIGFVAIRARHWLPHAGLFANCGAVALLGLWVVLANNDSPIWLPPGFMFTLPAALLLMIGAIRGTVGSRDIARR